MSTLLDIIKEHYLDYDAIVVEGYDGVGKGRVLNLLSKELGVVPYRPDYNMWQRHDHRKIDRWKVSGFFWDIMSHFKIHSDKPMLFDRGVLSGAVYNNDWTIALDYKNMLKDMKVLHVLVTCDKEDFIKYQLSRAETVDIESSWKDYINYTASYFYSFLLSGVEYLVYENHFNSKEAEKLKVTCEGCGHYNYGYCRHPLMNCKVDPNSKRCKYSSETEVQDLNDSEMQCVCSQ